MANLRELMFRLRPAGSPGAPSGAGVPTDRRKGVEQELEPVFAALASTVADGHRIRQDAQAQAQQRIAQGQEQLRAAMAQAELDAAATRAEVAARLRAQAQEDSARLVRQAHDTAKTVRANADQQLPHRIEAIMSRVREQLIEVERQ